MRLWHYDLIPYLPDKQLLSQWKELNSIYKKEDKHLLINYIYDYPKEYLKVYSDLIINEFIRRGFKIKSFEKYYNYFKDIDIDLYGRIYALDIRYKEHDDEYLLSNYFNLLEKYRRHQKQFSEFEFNNMTNFIKTKFKIISLM